VPVLTGLTHLFEISQVSPCLPIAGGAMTATAGSSSKGPGGAEPPPKRAHLESFLRVSSRYVRGVACCLCGSFFSCLLP
jgi:hypothetical protein